MVIDPLPVGPVLTFGDPLIGSRPTDATFYDGKYWYINATTDDLYSFDVSGGGDLFVGSLLADSGSFGFGDCSVDEDGVMICSGDRSDVPGMTVIFSVDLEAPLPNYTQHLAVDDAILQLAFGGEGTLFGHNGAENSLYYVSVVSASFGERGKVLDTLELGPFTDLSSFNELCDCSRGPDCPAGTDDDDDDNVCEADDDD